MTLPATCLTVMTLLLAVVWWQPRPDADVLVLASPWSARATAAEITVRAGGNIVAAGRWPFVIVAHSAAAPSQAAAFPNRLHAAGAILVLDAGLLAGCLSRS